MKYAEKQTRDESKVTNNEEQKDEEELHNKPGNTCMAFI